MYCTLNKKQLTNGKFAALCNLSFKAYISTEQDRKAYLEKINNEKKKDIKENLKQ